MCEKITYDSFFDAQTVVNKAAKFGRNSSRIRRLKNKIPKRVYRCEECGKYHLTSKLKKY